jgi:putative transposase
MKIDFNNLYTHFIFATAGRLPMIREQSRDRIEKYMTGIVAKHHSKIYSIYANPEHVHFLASKSPKISEEILATVVADGTQRFINNNQLISGNFAWQESCAAFSVSKSHVDKVCKYILNQPEHHRRVTFAEEYDKMMKFFLAGARWDVDF